MVGKLKSTEMVDNFMDPPPKQIKLGMVFIIYTLKKTVKPSILIQFIPFYSQFRVPKNDLEMTSTCRISIDEMILAWFQ